MHIRVVKKREEGGSVTTGETKKQVGGGKETVVVARLEAHLRGAAFPGLPGQAAEWLDTFCRRLRPVGVGDR